MHIPHLPKRASEPFFCCADFGLADSGSNLERLAGECLISSAQLYSKSSVPTFAQSKLACTAQQVRAFYKNI
jgi:hypothetical protein